MEQQEHYLQEVFDALVSFIKPGISTLDIDERVCSAY